MKFNIRDIGPDGRRVRETFAAADVHALLAEAGVSTEPTPDASLHLDLTLSREGNGQTVIARGSADARFQVACSRCLGPATIIAEEPELRLTFLPPPRPVATPRGEPAADEDEEGGQELELEDIDTFAHDGEAIDLRPVVRELLVLAIPMAPVCSESCKGLCPTCGADLNHASCGHAAAPAVKQTPWARALAGLKKS